MADDYDMKEPETPPEDPIAEEESPAEQAAEPSADMEISEKVNLAEFLTEDQQKDFARRCIDRFQRDVSSRAERMKKLKLLQQMYAMVTKAKSFPFHKAANVVTPTVAGPNLQIQARLYDMMIPPSGDLFHVLPGPDEAEIAHLGEKFGNDYIRRDIPQFEEGFDDLLHQVCLYGSAFRRTYGDSNQRRVCSDTVPIDDFVVAYGHRSRDPSMSDVEFYTYVQRMSVAEIQEYGMRDDPYFINTDQIKEESNSDPVNSEFRDAVQKVDGVTPDQEYEPHQVLECHCRYRLPKGSHPALDGERHWLVVYIDWPSEKVLRVALREEDDPKDLRRFQREQEKFIAAQQQMATAMAARDLMQPAPEIPELPPAPVEPKPIRKRQVCWYTHYRCFPSDGFYGLGYGDILYGLALAKNTLINQHIDGVTLRNAKPGFISRQLRIQRGSTNVQPGELQEVDGPAESIRKGIVFIDPPMNDPTTVPLINMLDGMSDILVGSADMLSGQVPGSNQAATSIQIFAEQAQMPITVLGRRLMKCFEHELVKIWRCFGVFLTDDEIADALRDSGNPISQQIGRQMFSPLVRLMPSSDPRTKQQRQQELQSLVGFLSSSPMTAPQANPAVAREVAVMGLRMFPDGHRFLRLLPPEQPQPPPPPPPVPSWEENAAFLNGKPAQVHPDDMDQMHVQDHMMFRQSPEGNQLAKEMIAPFEQHIRDHLAAQIRKANSGPGTPQGPGGGPPPVSGPSGQGPSPMAGPPGEPPPIGPPPGPPATGP